MTGRQFLLLILICLLAGMPAFAAEEPSSPDNPDSPEASEEDFDPPALSGSLDHQIAQLKEAIAELQTKADELVFANETVKKERVVRQINILKRQLKQLLLQKQMASRSQSEVGAEGIRDGYGKRIEAIEAQKADVRRKTIGEFETLLSQNESSPSRANIIFRLGLLYFEDDHYNYQRQQDAYLTQVNNLIDQGGDQSIGREPEADYSRALARFQEVVNDYPDFNRADFAHYMLAYCQTESNDIEGAIKTYKNLIAKFPTSDYVPEAHIRMGELYFDDNRMQSAIHEYNQVLKYPDSKFYDKALFKLGWSYYRLTESDPAALTRAVDYFTQVLEFYANRPRARIRGGDDLRQESVDYIAISFSDMDSSPMDENGYQAARKFIDDHPKYKWNKDILTKMAEVYFMRDRFELARRVIDERIQKWPDDPENPEIQFKLVDALVDLGERDQAIAVSEQIATMYGPGSRWSEVNKEKAGTIKRTQRRLAGLLFASATHHHEKAQRIRATEGAAAAQPQFKKAADSYVAFLTNYPEAKDSYEATFNLAECYSELQQYDLAASHYEKIIAIRKDKDYFGKAVVNLIATREQLFLAEPGWPTRPPEPGKESDSGKGERQQIDTVPLSPQAEAWVKAMQQHIDLLPESKDNPDIQFKIGEVYYYHGQFDEAVTTFRSQIAKYPDSEAAQVSMNLVIQALDRQGRYEELQQVAADYKNRVRVKVVDDTKGTTNVEVLDKIQVGAAAKIAEQKIKEGKLQEGVNEYLALANNNPSSDKAPIALHNAAATYIDMGKYDQANEIYLRIAQEYPKFEHAKKNLFFAATQYEKLIDFDRAVDTYMLYVNSYPDDELTKDALYNAALLRENNKQYDMAIAGYQQYLDRYPSTPDAVEIAFTIGKLYKDAGNDAAAEMAFENLTKQYGDAVLLTRAYLEWGNLAKKRGAWDEANRHYMQAAAVYTQASQVDPAAGAAYAAEAKFYIAELEYAPWAAIRLELPETVMEKQLIAKAEGYKTLNNMYKEIVQIGNFEWATAALFMIGKINKDFAESLFSAPIPEELNPEEQDVYIVKLEEMAYPLKKKSIEAFETNIDKGRAEKTRNKWIDQSYDELKKYKPELMEEKYELYTSMPSAAIPAPTFSSTAQPATAPAPAGSEGGQNP